MRKVKAVKEKLESVVSDVDGCVDMLIEHGCSEHDSEIVKNAKAAFIKAIRSVSFECDNCCRCSCCEMCDECSNCTACVECTECHSCDECSECYECIRCKWCSSCEFCYDCADCNACKSCCFCFGLNGENEQFFKVAPGYELDCDQKYIIDYAKRHESQVGSAPMDVIEAQDVLRKAKRSLADRKRRCAQ